MTRYLIEFRFQGRAKHEIKKLIYSLRKKFEIKSYKRQVPHITLIAPFETNNEKRLIKDFLEVCKKYNRIEFTFGDYSCFPRPKVIYKKVKPGKDMIRFRKDLLNRIIKYCSLCHTDINNFLGIFNIKRTYSPHITLAMGLTPNKFKQIKRYLSRKKEFSRKHLLARTTLLKKGKILYEYDFILRKLLNRSQAKNKEILSNTIRGIIE